MKSFIALRSNKIVLLLVTLLIIMAVFGPWLLHSDPNTIDLSARLQPASSAHWLGTDHLGRDIFARLIVGCQVSLSAVFAALALIVVLGISVGTTAALLGGRVDAFLMRTTDIFLTFPTLVLALFLIAVLGTGMSNVIIAIALSHWAWYARIVRSIVLGLKHREFILAARLCGNRGFSLFKDHLFIPIVSQLVVLASMDIGHMMLHVAGMSFLGLGVRAPTPEWGVMLSDARQFVWTEPLLMVWPGLALLISVLIFNWLGDALRDYLDPQLKDEK